MNNENLNPIDNVLSPNLATKTVDKSKKPGIKIPASDYFDWSRVDDYLTRDLLSDPVQAATHVNEFYGSGQRSYKSPEDIKKLISSIDEKCFYSKDFLNALNLNSNQNSFFPGQVLQHPHIKNKFEFINAYYQYHEKNAMGAIKALELPMFPRLELALKKACVIASKKEKVGNKTKVVVPQFSQLLVYIKEHFSEILEDEEIGMLTEMGISTYDDFIQALNLSAQYTKEQKKAKKNSFYIDLESDAFLSMYAKEFFKNKIDLILDDNFIEKFINKDHYGYRKEITEIITSSIMTYFLDKNLIQASSREDFCLSLFKHFLVKERDRSYKSLSKEDSALTIDYIIDLIDANLSQNKARGIFEQIINNYNNGVLAHTKEKSLSSGSKLGNDDSEIIDKPTRHELESNNKDLALIDELLKYFLIHHPQKLGNDFIFNFIKTNHQHITPQTIREFLVLSNDVEKFVELLGMDLNWSADKYEGIIYDFKNFFPKITNEKAINKILTVSSTHGADSLGLIKNYPDAWYKDEKEFIKRYSHGLFKNEIELKKFIKLRPEIMKELMQSKDYIKSVIDNAKAPCLFLASGQRYKKIGQDLDLNLAFAKRLPKELNYSWEASEYMNNPKFCTASAELLPAICAQNVALVKYLDEAVLSNKPLMIKILNELDNEYDPVEILASFGQSSEHRVKALFNQIEQLYSTHTKQELEKIERDSTYANRFKIAPAFEQLTSSLIVRPSTP